MDKEASRLYENVRYHPPQPSANLLRHPYRYSSSAGQKHTGHELCPDFSANSRLQLDHEKFLYKMPKGN
jgi:hypothetical protein